MMTYEERAELYVAKYGEACTKATAAKILGCSAGKIYSLLKVEMLDLVCEGTRVDVRSIARYMCEPAKANFEARKRRMMKRNGSNWAV